MISDELQGSNEEEVYKFLKDLYPIDQSVIEQYTYMI